jgi:hypothetical protein
VEAHRAGAGICARIISKPFAKKADAAVISAFPYNQGSQIMKPLAPASMITRKGGCIILCADCRGTIPDHFLEGFDTFYQRHGKDLFKGVMDSFDDNRLIFDRSPIEFNMAAAQVLLARQEFHLILVSRDLSREVVERMGFVFAEDPDRAFALASDLLPPRPEVHVVPSGGVILPVL